MSIPEHSHLHSQIIHLIDQTHVQSQTLFYLNIQNEFIDIISKSKSYPHLSLNPFTGNSLY